MFIRIARVLVVCGALAALLVFANPAEEIVPVATMLPELNTGPTVAVPAEVMAPVLLNARIGFILLFPPS